MTWKVTGVSWSRLSILPGLLFGAVAALTYGVLRLALSRLWALLMLLPAVTSTPNFMLVPQIRDYAKGPFLLAVILIMGVMVLGATDRWRAIAWSALAGVIVGVGFGFRTDLAIAVVPFLLATAMLVPSTVPMRWRAAAVGVFLASFAIVALPVLRGYSTGGNTGHVILLGLGVEFNRPLGSSPRFTR